MMMMIMILLLHHDDDNDDDDDDDNCYYHNEEEEENDSDVTETRTHTPKLVTDVLLQKPTRQLLCAFFVQARWQAVRSCITPQCLHIDCQSSASKERTW